MSNSALENALYDFGIDVAKLKAVAPVGGTAGAATATTTVAGTVLKGTAVANAAGATPTKAEYDGLLAVLRAAGHIT